MARRVQDVYASLVRQLTAKSVDNVEYPDYHPINIFVKPANIDELLANPKAGSNEEKVAKYLAETGKTFDELWESAMNHVHLDFEDYDISGNLVRSYSGTMLMTPDERAAIMLGDPNHYFENTIRMSNVKSEKERWGLTQKDQKTVYDFDLNQPKNKITDDTEFGKWHDYIEGGIKNMQKQLLKTLNKRG